MLQGYLPVEALILDVEVWGLAGKSAKDVQTSYKKREELFTEQRRKVSNTKAYHLGYLICVLDH